MTLRVVDEVGAFRRAEAADTTDAPRGDARNNFV